MSFDPYMFCPCGSGKKFKFCCSSITSEMEKISRMLEGDQYAACLQYVKTVQRLHPHQASLLGIRGMLEIELEHFDDAEQTIRDCLDRYPDNPVALAERATLWALTGRGDQAVDPLQKALTHLQEYIPEQVYQAVGAVGIALVGQERIVAGLAHLTLQARMAYQDDLTPLRLILQLRSNPKIPLLLKDEWPLATCPDGVAWKPAFDAAREDGLRGLWRRAAERFEGVLEPSGNAPEAWKSLAVVRSFLNDADGAVVAWRRYASLDVSLDEAVQAEALAQLLDPRASQDAVDLVRITYPVHQLEALEVALTGAPQTIRQAVTPPPGAEEGEPPPRCAFRLLDRPLPDTGRRLTTADVPATVAHVFVFGRETDRPARLVLVATRDERLTQAGTLLAQVGREMIGPQQDEFVVSRSTVTDSLLGRGWTFLSNTPPAEQSSLIVEKQTGIIRTEWLHRPMVALNGKTPAEAAADPALQIPALAAILVLESSPDRFGDGDLNWLRQELGLPATEPIDPTGLDVRRMPLVQLSRLIFQRLDDDALVTAWRLASGVAARRAALPSAREIVARASLRGSEHRVAALGMLAEEATDSQERLALLDQARQAAETQGQSSAPWDLRELIARIQRGEGEHVQRLASHIASVHGREPGVREKLLEILTAAGLIQPGGPPPDTAAQKLVVPGGADDRVGGIWTPDKQAGQQGQKPGIWTPGMD